MEEYNAKILEILPGTINEGDAEHIIDAYVKFKINNIQFWAFVYSWTKYFPYLKASDYLHKLINKKTRIKLKFLNLKNQKIEKKEKKLIPVENQKKPCDYELLGQITKKWEHPDPAYKNYEEIVLDFGILITTKIHKKDGFKVGEYTKMNGRLDAFFLEDPTKLLDLEDKKE